MFERDMLACYTKLTCHTSALDVVLFILISFLFFVINILLIFICYSVMSSKTITHLDLARLPVHQKDNLCKILDQKDRWEELGKLMQFSDFDIDVSLQKLMI